MSEIQKWYSGKSVFVTGATGFIGKCLVEKLLRSCDVSAVYIIIRNKRDLNFEQRKNDYLQHVVFSNLSSNTINKMKIIPGDLLAPNLGMSNENRKQIAENVSIIFHAGADVRFDRPISDTYLSNVAGTRKLLDFAATFRHLEVFLYLSTAFCQTHDIILEEKYYAAPVAPDLMDEIVHKVDADVLEALSHKILGKFPNPYPFSKCLSEDLVYQYRQKFPIAIGRPTIVISAWKEPLLGYTEGIHGLNGWCLAVGRGVLRSMHCQQEQPSNLVQSDIAVNAIIVLAYERHKKMCTEPIYFNIADGVGKALSWHQYLELLRPNFFRAPFDFALWKPGGSFKSNRFHNFICVVLFHLIPALLIDLLLIIFRFKPIMLKIQRKIQTGCDALNYYINNAFLFKTDNYDTVTRNLNEIDKEIFYNRSKLNFHQYFRDGAVATRVYLVNEKMENLPKARFRMRCLHYLDLFTRLVLWSWVFYRVLRYLEPSFFK